MPDQSWFRHWAKESLLSDDLDALTDHEERVWWRLLSAASLSENRWSVPFSQRLAAKCKSTPAKFARALETFTDRGMIDFMPVAPGIITISNAAKWNEDRNDAPPSASREATRARKAAQRERDKARTVSALTPVTVTTPSHGKSHNHIEEEIEKEQEPEKEQEEIRAEVRQQPMAEREMVAMLFSKLPLKFQRESEDALEDFALFARDFVGRDREVLHAIDEVKRDRKIPFANNLREYMPGALGAARGQAEREFGNAPPKTATDYTLRLKAEEIQRNDRAAKANTDEAIIAWDVALTQARKELA